MTLDVVDSDILSLYQQRNLSIRNRIAQHSTDELSVSIISIEEQLSSWYTMRRRAKTRERIAIAYDRFTENIRMLSGLQILSFSIEAIERYEQLLLKKLGVKGNDLRIAAIALENSAIVVTRNRRDFERIPGLAIEDWSQ
jgi:tRNA(fMet)-specific endonuclease VapC